MKYPLLLTVLCWCWACGLTPVEDHLPGYWEGEENHWDYTFREDNTLTIHAGAIRYLGTYEVPQRDSLILYPEGLDTMRCGMVLDANKGKMWISEREDTWLLTKQ